jgi:rod shape-determining protein MreD
MIRVLPRNIVRFVLLVLLQVLVFNNIQLGGYLNPYIYVLFLLLMPFETPRWLLLVAAFGLGISIDVFTNTLGMHAAATVFMAFIRPFVLNAIAPRDGYEIGTFPRLFFYGFKWFFKYSFILILAHHFVLFYLEVFSFAHFFHTLSRVLLSTVFSTLFIVLSQYIVFRK